MLRQIDREVTKGGEHRVKPLEQLLVQPDHLGRRHLGVARPEGEDRLVEGEVVVGRDALIALDEPEDSRRDAEGLGVGVMVARDDEHRALVGLAEMASDGVERQVVDEGLVVLLLAIVVLQVHQVPHLTD